MACDGYLNAINELVDGTLGPLRTAELQLHLESCEACARLAADLREIARAARSLDDLQPPARVWSAIAGALRMEGRVTRAPRRVLARPSNTILALAAALVIAVGASLLLLIPRESPPSEPAAAAVPAPAGNAVDGPAVQDIAGLTKQMAETEQSLKDLLEGAKNSSLAPQTVAVLQENFLVITDAMQKTRNAVEGNPQDVAARHSFYEMLRQQIRFLQDTIALMNEMRQGDAAGAAEIVEGKS